MGYVTDFNSDENEKTFFVDFTKTDPLNLDSDPDKEQSSDNELKKEEKDNPEKED